MARTASAKSSLIGNLGSQHDYVWLKHCDNLLNRQRHFRIANVSKTQAGSTPDAKPVFLVLFLRQSNCTSHPASFPRRHHANSTTQRVPATVKVSQLSTSDAPVELWSSRDEPANVTQTMRHAAIMIIHDYLSWIVFLSKPSGQRVRECG